MTMSRGTAGIAIAALATTLLVGAALLVGPALADAIDGSWCSPDGRTLAIDGPHIRTPGGRNLDGTYDRHAFYYKAPNGEPGAGKGVNMVLLGDNTIHLTPEGKRREIWHRCKLQTS